jgi:hypothetical protein
VIDFSFLLFSGKDQSFTLIEQDVCGHRDTINEINIAVDNLVELQIQKRSKRHCKCRLAWENELIGWCHSFIFLLNCFFYLKCLMQQCFEQLLRGLPAGDDMFF